METAAALITLPLITRIQMSSKRRKKYFLKGRPIPKKYKNKRYVWKKDLNSKDKNFKLFDTETGSFVVKNIKSIDKPSYIRINGQDLYSGNMNPMTRATFINKFHAWFEEHLNPFAEYLKEFIQGKVIKYEMIFYKIDDHKTMDVDNHWIYEKVFQDTLTNLKIIPDDCPKYIRSRTSTIKTVEKEENCKIVIKISEYV